MLYMDVQFYWLANLPTILQSLTTQKFYEHKLSLMHFNGVCFCDITNSQGKAFEA